MNQVIWSATPKARQRHICDNCGRAIDPGETYLRLRLKYEYGDDTPSTWKECAHCQAFIHMYIDDFADPYDGYSEDDIRDWDPQTPEAVEHKQQWLSRWHNTEGNLYPVPAESETGHVEVRKANEAYL